MMTSLHGECKGPDETAQDVVMSDALLNDQGAQSCNEGEDDGDSSVVSKASSFDGSASMSSSDCQPTSSRTDQAKPPKKRKLAGSGRWSDSEHKAFLIGLSRYGREWKRVAQDIPTRTSAQVRSHAQKYFAKISKHHEVSESVRLHAERIMADPAAAEAEVKETLRQLKVRYAELKKQQEVEQQQQNDAEMIAVDVLRGGLRGSP
jgi:SHAQKYF class myb-like DNA-binding protein